jgi:hypothetical protein
MTDLVLAAFGTRDMGYRGPGELGKLLVVIDTPFWKLLLLRAPNQPLILHLFSEHNSAILIYSTSMVCPLCRENVYRYRSIVLNG